MRYFFWLNMWGSYQRESYYFAGKGSRIGL